MKLAPHNRPTYVKWLLGLMVMVLTLVPAERSNAQLSAVAQAMEPEFFTRDLLIFIEGLDLDETQAVIAEAIFDDYEQQFDQGKLRMEEEIEELTTQLKDMRGQGKQDQILEMVVKPIQDWLIRREDLNQQLIENVKIILVPEQQELWTEFNRRLYREKKLDDGTLSGERIDLFIIARDTNVDAMVEPVKSVMNDYSLQLDQALHARQRLIEGKDSSLLDSLQNRSNNPSVDIEVKMDIIDHRVKVRDLNDFYREEIASNLPSEVAEAFKAETLRRAYPKVYRMTGAERIFDTALETYNPGGDNGIPGPKADKAIYDAIWNLYAEYLGELALLNDTLYTTTRSSEPAIQKQRLENMIRRASNQEVTRPTNPLAELQQEKRELEASYIAKLRALLGDDAFFELNGTRRWDDRGYNPEMGGNASIKLRNDTPLRGGKGKKGTKPDNRPDKEPKEFGNGAGLGTGNGVGNRQDD